MSLARNKKGIELSTLAEILLVVLTTGLIIAVLLAKTSEADEKTSENLCRGFNALRFGTKVETSTVSFNVAPRACKTIYKNDLPSKDYKDYSGGATEGAKAEIRDLMARCWWLWLEGNQQNMFEKNWYNLQNGCFICYTFSLKKDTSQLSYEDFAASLNSPYYAIDKTSRCAPGGQGGKCMSSCEKNSDFSREVASNRCQQNEKCCIAPDLRDECINKGGRCSPTEGYVLYNKWSCKSGSCFIKKENLASYLDYIQGTSGVNGGAGKVIFGDNEGFNSGSKYAITFISPGKGWNLQALLNTAGAGVGVYAIGTYVTGLAFPPLLLVTATGGLLYLAKNEGEIKDINYILISKFDTVAEKCAVESGVGQK